MFEYFTVNYINNVTCTYGLVTLFVSLCSHVTHANTLYLTLVRTVSSVTLAAMSRSATRLLSGIQAARRACADLSSSVSLQGCSRVLAQSAGTIEASRSAVAVARTFWTSAPSKTTSLVNILKEELKHESQSYVKPDAIASGPPAPFTLSEAPGDTMLTLTRTYQGESISVDLHVNNQPSPEYETENEEETL